MAACDIRGSGDAALRRQRFVEEVFRPLPRADQRHWARTYLRGLLSAAPRKTPGQLAAAQSLPPAAAHSLHQFVNASSWEWEPVRHALARQVCAHTTPAAWTVAELVIPKGGRSTVGVHSLVDASTGRSITGQHVLGLFLGTDAGSFPVSWRLLLRDGWADDRVRRRRARIPERESARPMREHLLDLVGDALRAALPRLPWLLDLSRLPDADAVLTGLARRGLDAVCEVAAPSGAARVADDHRGATGPFRLVEGLESRRVLTTLTSVRARELAEHGPDRARSTVARLDRHFGVRDFLGRSFPGWHHHMTMASAAHAYQRLFLAPRPPVPRTAADTVAALL